jgi:hypothetical protein
MKHIITTFIVAIVAALSLQAQTVDRERLISSLSSIDSNIVQYFPRWKVCEADLRVQIHQNFLLFGYPEDSLSRQDIVITAAPREDDSEPFTLLLIECGSQVMVASEIESNMQTLGGIISGGIVYKGPYKGEPNYDGQRSYCYTELPRAVPLSTSQKEAIVDFLQPRNVNHAIVLSLFEQTLKVGASDFYLRSEVGTDEVGYHFWSAGESKVTLRRPLYENHDSKTRETIPFILDAYLGVGYRITGGLDNSNSALDFLTSRGLNAGPGGKLIAGLDFHIPSLPEAGIHVNLELPLGDLEEQGVDNNTYAQYTDRNRDVEFLGVDQVNLASVAPLLRSTGQITAFYNWWIDPSSPENYFRFDAGISYAEVREVAIYSRDTPQGDLPAGTFLGARGFNGLRTFKPSEFGDWVFLKAAYRSQSAYPFGISLQYSNQILLGRVYVPLFGQWFYLEGKYSTPLRTARQFEVENFFMISPVLRFTL